MLLCLVIFGPLSAAHGQAASRSPKSAQNLEVEWYQAEVENSVQAGLVTIIISGKTQPDSLVTIDGKNITLIKSASELESRHNCRLLSEPTSKSKVVGSLRKGNQVTVLETSGNWFKVSSGGKEGYAARNCFASSRMSVNVGQGSTLSPQTKSNSEGYFELSLDQPPGLVQIPIVIAASGESKTYLITFDIDRQKVRMNTKISNNKPPAASKHLRLWLGVGTTYQKYSQTVGGTDVSFVNVDSPSLLGRFGYWGDTWGIDLFFRDAPGKIDEAVQPFTVSSTKYHWMTVEARGSYQFARASNSRLFGLPSQWLLFFGAQHHQMPFLDIDLANKVSVRKHSLTMATVGAGLLLGQERKWTHELSIEYQFPVSASGESGNSFSVTAPLALDARLGTAYKIAPNWRVGTFIYVQSHNYKFKHENKAQGTQSEGKQSLFYSTFDLHLGYEY